MDSNESPPLKQRKVDEQHLLKSIINYPTTNEELFKGEQLLCLNRMFFSTGNYNNYSVYHGLWKGKSDLEEKKVAVRRIKAADCQETWNDVVDKHLITGQLRYDNLLKIIGVETDAAQTRYFALELYAATLEQYCTRQYNGPVPSEDQVLYQIAKGVDYLHKNGLAHGNLNPQTILIGQSQPVRMKVAEFGLCKYYCGEDIDTQSQQLIPLELCSLNNMTNNHELITDEVRESNCSNDLSELEKLSHPKYWTREKYESLPVDQEGKRPIPRATINGDIFAFGCLCFYYLKRGLHPFGDSKSIFFNISKMRPVNLKELAKAHFFYWIKNLIGSPPRDGTNYLRTFISYLKKDFPLKINEKNELGRGAFGIVFAGTFDGKEVAVKRISVAVADAEAINREMEYHNRLDHHNVLKLLHVEEEKDPNFKYLVLELCAGTLLSFCENKYKGPNLPPDVLVVFQIASGLDYIHSKKLVHRDIKPDNILISITSPVQMKLSDFGYCRPISPKGTFSQSGLKGTLNWMAPEFLKILNNNPDSVTNDLPQGTIESDTFAAGCVFFYFLTRGSHPFGNGTQVPANICSDNPVLLNEGKLLPADNVCHALIGGMIRELKERTKLEEVIQQLALFLLQQSSTIKFKKVTRTLTLTTINRPNTYVCSRFHPIDPVLAYFQLGDGHGILFETTNRLLPFFNWKENKMKFTHDVIGKEVTALEWNVNGTQLAAGFEDGTVIAWSYPSGQVIFRMKKYSDYVKLIVWNPFRQDVFATRSYQDDRNKLLLWNTQENGDAEKANHFLTMERDEMIRSVAWISENQIALGLEDGRIEIFQIDDIKQEITTERIIKRFKHSESWRWNGWINALQWNETTGYLAAGSYDGRIKIWSMDSKKSVYSLEADSGCWSLTWRRKGKTWSSDEGIEVARKSKENLEIVCGLKDGSIVIWNPLEEDEGKRKRILPQKHSRCEVSLSFSPDGRFLASSVPYCKQEIIIWSTETWQSVYSCENAGSNLSWLSMDSSSFPVYKLNGHTHNELFVIEQPMTEGDDDPKYLANRNEFDMMWMLLSSSFKS